MQRYTVYLYPETALRFSGGTSTHHQERIRLYLQHLVFVTPFECAVGGVRHPQHTQTGSNCVKHLVGYILDYICDARTHERQTIVNITRRNYGYFLYLLFLIPVCL